MQLPFFGAGYSPRQPFNDFNLLMYPTLNFMVMVAFEIRKCQMISGTDLVDVAKIKAHLRRELADRLPKLKEEYLDTLLHHVVTCYRAVHAALNE